MSFEQYHLPFRSGPPPGEERVNVSRLFPGKPASHLSAGAPKGSPANKGAGSAYKSTGGGSGVKSAKPTAATNRGGAVEAVKRNFNFGGPPVGGFDILGNIMSGMENNVKKDG